MMPVHGKVVVKCATIDQSTPHAGKADRPWPKIIWALFNNYSQSIYISSLQNSLVFYRQQLTIMSLTL
jgi:hypothetical protein